MFEWDKKKRLANLRKHGVDFNAVWDLDWSSVIDQRDLKSDYGEERFVMLGLIEARLCSIAYTWRGTHMRIISLRPASMKERGLYEEAIESFDD